MSVTYFYQRNGQKNGPVSAAQLRELAAAGQLSSNDQIRRADMDKWVPASKVTGLFPTATPTPSASTPNEPAAPVASSAAPTDAAGQATPVQPPPPPLPDGSVLGQTISDRIGKLRPIAERYAHEFGLAMELFLAVLAGSTCLILLVLSTFMTWEINSLRMGGVLAGVGDTKKTVGLEIQEGKFVCLLALIGIGCFAATFFVRRLLPISLLVAGAAGTCSLVLALSYKHQINRSEAEIARVAGAISRNFGAMYGEEGQKSAEENIIPQERDVAGLGLYLAILTSLVVAPALVFVALFKPVEIPYLQKESIHPFARKHGGLLIAQGIALLVGLAAYIMRY